MPYSGLSRILLSAIGVGQPSRLELGVDGMAAGSMHVGIDHPKAAAENLVSAKGTARLAQRQPAPPRRSTIYIRGGVRGLVEQVDGCSGKGIDLQVFGEGQARMVSAK